MKKEIFIKLLSKKLSGTISEPDHESLHRAMEQHREFNILEDKIKKYFKIGITSGDSADQLNQTWKLIALAEEENQQGQYDFSAIRQTNYGYFLKIAAVFFLLIGLGFLSYQFLNQGSNDFDTLYTSDQKTFRLLDDGTRVWLNKKSSISYSKSFGSYKREIFLKGEGFFDVRKNENVPLIIHAGNINIEVKGTAFNVKAYPDNTEIQVALMRGAIRVSEKNAREQLLLKPNQKLIYAAAQPSGSKSNFRVISLSSESLLKDSRWMVDTLSFRKERFKDLVLRMEKRYGLKITIQSATLGEKRFTGTITDGTIQQFLEALKISYPFTYTIKDRLVIIKD